MENNSLKRFHASSAGSSDSSSTRSTSKMDAVEVFTSRALSFIPGGWIEGLLKARDEPFAMPICLGMFLIDDVIVAESVKQHFCEDIYCADDDRQRLIDSGWSYIPPTGLFAREIDGFVVLGIDGLGYDFFVAHWEPLYDLLGYKWHWNE